jgi:hypothetical protein
VRLSGKAEAPAARSEYTIALQRAAEGARVDDTPPPSDQFDEKTRGNRFPAGLRSGGVRVGNASRPSKFATSAGVALSIYRDRLLALPDQIVNREGFFRIIDWR